MKAAVDEGRDNGSRKHQSNAAAAQPDRLDTRLQTLRSFIRDIVVPIEDRNDGDVAAAGGDALRRELQSQARTLGVYGPHLPVSLGGLGLGLSRRIPFFEEAGYSLFGPLALNAAAPDEANSHLLNLIASDEQKDRYLSPLAKGEVRSSFAMTEPRPGAGADPRRLSTRAEPAGRGWRISGRKTLISGAQGASFLIVMARTSGEPGQLGGATMFLVPADTPGVEIVRHVPTIDRSMVGGHCEIVLNSIRVSPDAVLGNVDEGFRHAQARLGPGRVTHVMRWLGAARRAQDLAVAYVATRPAFGTTLGDLGMVQGHLADNEIDLAATDALLRQACEELDSGEHASMATSIAKAFAGEALYRVVDRAAQVCGGAGLSADLPIARLLREIRPFRIYDGPTDVHRWSIGRRVLRRFTEQAS